MKTLLTTALLLAALPTWSHVITLSNQRGESGVEVVKMKSGTKHIHEIQFRLNQVDAVQHPVKKEFSVLSEKNISFTQDVGQARVPFHSVVVQGTPSDITVISDPGTTIHIEVDPELAQPEECRCEVREQKWVQTKQDNRLVRMDYLGKYRGQDLTRVTFKAARVSNGATTFYPNFRAQIESLGTVEDAMMVSDSPTAYDYLVIGPDALLAGIQDFVQYKTVQGFNVKVVRLEDVGSDVAKITAFFKQEYKDNKFKYALLVGNDTLFPNHKVSTSGSSKTPSDYPYFLMDTQDMLADVQSGRVVAATADEVSRQAKKWMVYQDHKSPAAQYLQMIGIASNEGANPSDEEYVKGIESDIGAAYGVTSTHFYQNDATSRPNFINDAFNKGIGYLVYLGHGSGFSWGSTGTSYSTTNIPQMDNANVLQPVLIDVACQNGILKKGYFGEAWLNATNTRGESIGAAMYYGGTVNISWHPPAIMAKGMVKKAIAQKLTKIGDILLAGQVYLMENYTSVEEVKDNMEWYHLFGDPSSLAYLK